MREITQQILVLVSFACVAGCFGGHHDEVLKTIAHDEGTINVTTVTEVSPRLEARSGGEAWTDLTGASDSELDRWLEARDRAEARSYIMFDNAMLKLEDRTVNRPDELEEMQDYLDERMDEVNDFLREDDDEHLDASDW